MSPRGTQQTAPDEQQAHPDLIRAGSRRLWPYIRRHWGVYCLGLLTLALTNLFVVSVPWLISRMVNLLEGDPIDLTRLRHLLLMVFAVAAAGGIIRVASRLLIFNVGRTIEYELRRTLFRHLQRIPVSVFSHRSTGDLVSRATNDLNAVRLLFGFGMLNLLNTPILFTMTVSIMFSLNARLTPAVMAIFPVVIFSMRRYSRRMFDLTQKVQGSLGDISAAAQENFSAVQVVRSYTLEERETARMRTLSRQYLAQSVKLALTRNILFNVMAAVIGLSELVLLGFGGWEIIQGRLSMGDLVAFNVYLGMLIWPTMAFGFLMSVWQRGMAAMSRIEEVLAEPEEEETVRRADGTPWKHRGFWEQGVEVSGLTWGYPDTGDLSGKRGTDTALNEIRMRIPGGRFTALVGPTGCGKTTLTRLLTRLYNPPAGTVTIGGTDLTTIPLEELRRHLAVATQESFLFSRTLAENIGFGRPEASREEIEEAAENAQLLRDLGELPSGFETRVGERGITLSGGQRQRAAIARVLVYGAPIVLFDDSFSSVDLKTESRILSRLRERLRGRTVLLITHRIATACEAERIYVMDRGRIVEQGDHGSLLAAGGLYARLAEIQKINEELESTE
jgi:ATP-binding cassette subfamily B multidrug efflux pump